MTMPSMLFLRCVRLWIFIMWMVIATVSSMSVPSTPWRWTICVFFIDHFNRWLHWCWRNECWIDWIWIWIWIGTFYTGNRFFIRRKAIICFGVTFSWHVSSICEIRWIRTVHINRIYRWSICLPWTKIKTNQHEIVIEFTIAILLQPKINYWYKPQEVPASSGYISEKFPLLLRTLRIQFRIWSCGSDGSFWLVGFSFELVCSGFAFEFPIICVCFFY